MWIILTIAVLVAAAVFVCTVFVLCGVNLMENKPKDADPRPELELQQVDGLTPSNRTGNCRFSAASTHLRMPRPCHLLSDCRQQPGVGIDSVGIDTRIEHQRRGRRLREALEALPDYEAAAHRPVESSGYRLRQALEALPDYDSLPDYEPEAATPTAALEDAGALVDAALPQQSPEYRLRRALEALPDYEAAAHAPVETPAYRLRKALEALSDYEVAEHEPQLSPEERLRQALGKLPR